MPTYEWVYYNKKGIVLAQFRYKMDADNFARLCGARDGFVVQHGTYRWREQQRLRKEAEEAGEKTTDAARLMRAFDAAKSFTFQRILLNEKKKK